MAVDTELSQVHFHTPPHHTIIHTPHNMANDLPLGGRVAHGAQGRWKGLDIRSSKLPSPNADICNADICNADISNADIAMWTFAMQTFAMRTFAMRTFAMRTKHTPVMFEWEEGAGSLH